MPSWRKGVVANPLFWAEPLQEWLAWRGKMGA